MLDIHTEHMDLIDDLSNDLAVAFLIERRHSNKLNSREALDLIGKVKSALEPVSVDVSAPAGAMTESTRSATSEH